MLKKRLTVVIAILCMPVLLLAQGIDYKGFPQWSLQKKDSTEYALYTPTKMELGKKYPIALFMHGCCGKDYHASLRNAVDPPVRMWHNFGANTQQVPTYIISPATSQGWQQHFKNLKAVMDDLVANHQGDPQRIYVCGFSMGGRGTYQIIQAYPNYFAAAIAMGMDFSGDSTLVKDIPLWMNQGETDWWTRNMRKQVAAIRVLNGLAADTGSTWITGVNPRYTNFKGIGHAEQWPSATKQDITGWAYSKINDGNKYPTVYFSPAAYPVNTEAGKPVKLSIYAADPDGSISKVALYVNNVLFRTLKKAPYEVLIKPVAGDNLIEAVAYDNKGKQTTGITIVKVNIQPALISKTIAASNAGEYYYTKLGAKGNGELIFSLKANSSMPEGIRLYPDGTIKGITAATGNFKFEIELKDEDDEICDATYSLLVNAKKTGNVLVSDITSASGAKYRLGKMMLNEAPFFNSKDAVLTTDLEEINFSDVNGYDGLTFIQTNVNDADTSLADFLSFTVDEDAVVYVAYEKLNNTMKSTIPAWLNDFAKEKGEIAAQYRYFDVYSKKYSKGSITLPAAEAKRNNVSSNYFVMIKKQSIK